METQTQVKRRILVIDDEADFCFFVRKNLEQLGKFEVLTALNGEEGLRLARERKPDLILLDVRMPGVTGPDVADTLRQDPLTENIPLVFLTALVTPKEIGAETIKEIGGHEFIAKPIDTDRLVSCINRLLRFSSV